MLKVNFSYETSVDDNGNTLFCYVLPDGNQSPTLHVRPGDTLVLTLTNNTPVPTSASKLRMQMNTSEDTVCGAESADDSSTNVHFHGTNTSPVCHQDDVIHTLVNAGQSFTYNVVFPKNEPPGLYWYHPHVHGLSEAAVLGGASGAIVVDGIQNVQPAVAGLPQRVLLVRDHLVPGNPTPGGDVPSWDISLNYIPVPYPDYPPAIIPMKAGAKQLWRLVNACADTILDIQLQYDGVAQPLKIVALDGVPTGSQDGTRHGKIVTKTDILLPPAARAEFIVTAPKKGVQSAILSTQNIDTGPDGDDDPTRPIAAIETPFTTASSARPQAFAEASADVDKITEALPAIPAQLAAPNPQRFEGLAAARPSATRVLYFSEVLSDPNNPNSPTNFYITVDGDTPTLFDPSNPPAITTTQGSVEDWTIENRALENHEFHIHQIHFLLLDRNGVPVAPQDEQMLDMVQVPYWSGSGPYPSVTVRMDFRGPDIGDFVYHCHILGHEDAGMMAIIRVVPQTNALLAGPEELFAWLFDSPSRKFAAMCIRGRTSYQRRAALVEDGGWPLQRTAGLMILVFATIYAGPRLYSLRRLFAAMRRSLRNLR
ncbi:MAG: multicopper oxidase domain-containing protein [Candidatus Binataceae bacterium]